MATLLTMEKTDARRDAAEVPFVITLIEGRGEGLRATRRIEKGELIFAERPFIWASKVLKTAYACYSCGTYLRSMNGSRCATVVACPGCPATFCSLACEDEARTNGHRFVCRDASPSVATFDSYVDETGGDAHMSHSVRLLGVALVFYRRVAEACLRSHGGDGGPPLTAQDAADALLAGYQREDYCKTVHAMRCGTLEVDEDIFERMIGPAYVESHLAAPLALIKSIFRNDAVPWGDGDVGRARMDAFVDSPIFEPQFFKELLGTFSVNNLEVRIRDDDAAAGPAAPLASADTAAVAEFEQGQRHENDNVLRGTGLNYLYSRMNHSCRCNTMTDCGARAMVRVYAARTIEAHEEITTTYLHLSEDADGASLGTYKQRRKALYQYLFQCECPLCEAQKGDPDSSDDDY